MKIFWINLDKISYETLFNEITRFEKQNIVFTPNPEILLKTKKDLEFKTLIEKANFLTIDWIWIYIWFQILDNSSGFFINLLKMPYYIFNLFFRKKYLYEKFWERICWSDLTLDLVKFSQKNWEKITIIDLYNPTDLKKVASQKKFVVKLKENFSELKFDYFIYEPSKKDYIINKIKLSDSKIVFSTLWMKRQEESVLEIMSKCPNIKLWLWIGSSFDYFVWMQKRAPKFWRNIWLEWLYRLITWPQKIKRLNRLWNAIFVFSWEVLREKK